MVTIVDVAIFPEGCSDFYCQILAPTSLSFRVFEKTMNKF